MDSDEQDADAEIGSIMDDRDDVTDGQEENVSSTTTVAVTTATTTISNVHDRPTMTPNATTTTTSSNQSPQLATHKMPEGPPNEWSIEDVIQYISGTDSALAVHADLFRKHVSPHRIAILAFPTRFD